jgi:poly-gamma-glutamate synthesis protein (capsule biosynthesis protein)
MIYDSERGDIRMVAVGDTMLTCRLSPYSEPDYVRLVDIMRRADVTFANLETTVRTPDEGNPDAAVTGTVMSTPPELIDEVKWMGIDIVATANNHAFDYGVAGVVASMAHLRRACVPFAGTGATLGQARAPAYVETGMGRVGLVATTSATGSRDFSGACPESTVFAALGRASDARPDAPGRPGTNPLRFTKTFTVDAEAMAALARIKDGLGFTKQQKRDKAHFYAANEAAVDGDEEIAFIGGNFRRGKGFAISTAVNRDDADANLRQIRDARRRADWVIVSFHNHECSEAGSETAQSKADLEEPAAFAIEFARAAIDAGADMVAGHGPHVALGVEIYKGRPIFHSLGNFVLQNDLVAAYPAEVYSRFGLSPDATPADFIDTRSRNDTAGFGPAAGFWQGLLAECEFRNRELAAVRLHPLDLGFKRTRSQRGRPLLARGDVAREILERTRRLSKQYHGTMLAIEGETGLVVLK